jgi:hypothetical protein
MNLFTKGEAGEGQKRRRAAAVQSASHITIPGGERDYRSVLGRLARGNSTPEDGHSEFRISNSESNSQFIVDSFASGTVVYMSMLRTLAHHHHHHSVGVECQWANA